MGTNVLPPFLANMTVGIVLYTSYMAMLPTCTGGHESENLYPPPKFRGVFAAGATAGISFFRISDYRCCSNDCLDPIVNIASAFRDVIKANAITLVVCLFDNATTGTAIDLFTITVQCRQRVALLWIILRGLRICQTARILLIPKLLLRRPSTCAGNRPVWTK
jgi:hypothetical protein